MSVARHVFEDGNAKNLLSYPERLQRFRERYPESAYSIQVTRSALPGDSGWIIVEAACVDVHGRILASGEDFYYPYKLEVTSPAGCEEFVRIAANQFKAAETNAKSRMMKNLGVVSEQELELEPPLHLDERGRIDTGNLSVLPGIEFDQDVFPDSDGLMPPAAISDAEPSGSPESGAESAAQHWATFDADGEPIKLYADQASAEAAMIADQAFSVAPAEARDAKKVAARAEASVAHTEGAEVSEHGEQTAVEDSSEPETAEVAATESTEPASVIEKPTKNQLGRLRRRCEKTGQAFVEPATKQEYHQRMADLKPLLPS